MYRQDLWFLWSARCLMMLYISMKFQKNILNGFQIIKQTRFCDRQTDGWMDRQQRQKRMCPSVQGGGTLNIKIHVFINVNRSDHIRSRV